MTTAERFMRMAIESATENVRTGAGGPFACLIVRSGQVIATGTNRVTTSNDPTAHAEIVAIREACRVTDDFQLTGCDIYASCEPCPMCLGAIYWARAGRIFYAGTAADAAAADFDDSAIWKELCMPPEQRKIEMSRIILPDALAPFRAWAEKPDRIPY